MKKLLCILMALVLVCGLAACGGSPSQSDGGNGGDSASGDKVIKIGVFEPSSGDNGAGGKQEVLGIQYANSLVNTVEIGGETYSIQLEVVDNQSSTDKAPSAASSLVSAGVSVVLGSYGSGVSIAAGDIFAQAKIPAIGCSCTNPQVTAGNDYYFRVCFLDPFQGTVMANFAFDQGCKKAYVLTQLGDDYSVGLGNYFAEAFEALGGEVVTENFQEGNSDYTAYLTNAVNGGCDVFFSPSSTTAASLILSQAASQGVTMPIMAGDTWESSVILEAAQGTELQVYVSTFFDENDESSTTASEFVSGFKAWLNADSQNKTNNGGNDIVAAVSALGYDAYMVAVEAIKAAGSADGEAIAAALSGVSYSGVTGSVTFDENGDANKDMAYIKSVDVDNNAFVFVKTQTIADLG